MSQAPDTAPNDVADILDTLISIFSLDDDPGKLIRAHYVTNEAERRRIHDRREALATTTRKD